MANSKNITFDQLQAALSRVKSALDGKANTSHGNHVPKTEAANNAKFLRNDNTWQTVTPVNIGAADRSHSHGSYVNQNAFTNIKVGDTTVVADSPTDTLTLTAGTNITLTPDATNDNITIGTSGTLTGSLTGNATTASTLANSRKFTIGNATRNFNGSADVSWTLSEIGAAPSSHTHEIIASGNNHITTRQENDCSGLEKKNNVNIASWYGFSISNNCSNTQNYNQVVFSVDARNGNVWARGTVNAPTFSGSLSGNATSANKLANARKFSIGSAEKSFDGTGDVSWSVDEIGAIPLGGSLGISGTLRTTGEFQTTSANGLRLVYGDYGFFIRNDGNNTYFMLTNSGDQYGGWNDFRPMMINHNTGHVFFGNGLTGDVTGNASTATKLAKAISIKIGNTSKNFDGSSNVTWTLDEIGVASSSHTHNYLPLTGGTLSGVTYVETSLGDSMFKAKRSDTGVEVGFGVGSSGTNHGVYSTTANKWIVYCDGTNSYLKGNADTATTATTCTGNSATATKLQTARTITFNGAVSGSGTFDGSGDITIGTTFKESTVGAYWNNGAVTVRSDGVSEMGKYIDLHSKTDTKVDFNTRIVCNNTGANTINLPTVDGTFALLSDNVASATKLQTARKLTIGSTGKTFNGTADVAWTLEEIGAAATSHGTHVTYATAAPLIAGTAAVGTSNKVAREDHVHPLQETVNRLATARKFTIGNTGKTFNGTADVSWTLDEIGAASSGHTHNYAASPSAGGSAYTLYLPRVTENANTLPGSNKSVIKEYDPASSNLPNSEWYHILTNHSQDSKYGSQFALGMTADRVYYRNYSVGTWNSWKQLAFTDSSITGNAATATKLQGAKTLTIGNAGKSFDGSANVSWSLDEIGVTSAINNKVKDLKIGGTNLVSGTKDFSSGWYYDGFTLQNGAYDGTFKACYVNWKGTSGYHDIANNGSVHLEPNTEYTVSFWAKGTGKFWSYLYKPNTAVVDSGYNSSGTTTTSPDGAIRNTLSDSNFKRYWITWKTKSDLTPGQYNLLPCRVSADTGNCHIAICGIKFEIGNKATDWCPSPHDIDSAINQKANDVLTTVSNTYATKTALNTVDGKFANYSTTSQMNTAINNKANEITSNAGSTYATKTQLTQTSNDLTTKFKNASGINLIRNSTAIGGKNGWQGNIAYSEADYVGRVTGNRRFFYINNKNTTENYAFSPRFALKANTKYTLSCWMYRNTTSTGYDIFVLSSNTLPWTSTSTACDNVYHLHSGLSTGWERVEKTFTTGANDISGFVRIDNNGYTGSGDANDANVHFGSLMLTEGTIAYPWTPHPSECYNGITQIDSEGIKIKNDDIDANSYTQITHTGFWFNKAGKDLIKATSGGVEITGTLTGNASTATKLQNARTLTIGNTGKAFDGSGNVSWSLGEIGAAASNHGHSNMLTFKSNHIGDWTNATSMADKVYMGGWHGSITDASKTNGYISLGLNSTQKLDIHLDGDYYANENNLVLNAGNYNDYAPSKTGTGATGTWRINITGNSGAADVLNQNTRMEYGWNGVNYFNINATAGNAAKVNDTPTSNWWHMLRFNHANGHGYYTDLAVPFNSNSLYYKRVAEGAVQNGGWVKVLDSLNYSEYTAHNHDNIYLKLSGGNMTGDITFNGISDTKYPVNSSKISWSGGSDAAEIYYRLTAADKGQLVLNLKDDPDVTIGIALNGTVKATFDTNGYYSGKANQANTLATARTLTIGNTGKSFNGSGNVSWNLSEIGAIPLAGSTDISGTLRTNGELQSTSAGAGGVRVVGPNHGFFIRVDESYTYFMLTDSGKQYNSWNDLRPIMINNTNGHVSFGNGLTGTLNGNASTATTLQTARTLTIGNTGKAFDGSGNVSWSLSEIGAASSGHTHNYAGSTSAGGPAISLYMPRTGDDGDANTLPAGNTSRIIEYGSGNKNLPNAAWYHILSNSSPDTRYASQLALGMTTTQVHFRNYNNGAWSSWNKLAFENDVVKKSGDTMSGQLTVNNNVYSQGFCVSKNGKEVWLDIGDNDTYIWASGANKSLQITHSGDLNFDGKPVLYGGRGNNYDTATSTIYFNNSATSHKGRISCYNNTDGDYVQLALRTADATTNYMTVRTDTVNFGSAIVVQGHKVSIATSAPSSPSTGDVWINIG